jgi:hypothetical protein
MWFILYQIYPLYLFCDVTIPNVRDTNEEKKCIGLVFIWACLIKQLFCLKKAVFWDVALCRSGVNRCFGGTYRLHLQGRGEKLENPHAKCPSETRKQVCKKIEWFWEMIPFYVAEFVLPPLNLRYLLRSKEFLGQLSSHRVFKNDSSIWSWHL